MDDNDDNILIESDDEGTTSTQKRKSTSDFIPKPKLIPSHVTKLVRTPASSPTHDHGKSAVHDDIKLRSNSHLDSTSEYSTRKPELKAGGSNSLPKTFILQSEPDSPRDHQSGNGVHISPSAVHLVERQDSSIEDRQAESTYKRLISLTRRDDRLEAGDEPDIVQTTHRGICRVVKHPTVRKNWKVYLASVVLTFLGGGLMVLGLAIGFYQMGSGKPFHNDLKSVIFLVGGIILFVPGVYHFVYMTLAACGVRGFKFTKLPTLRL